MYDPAPITDLLSSVLIGSKRDLTSAGPKFQALLRAAEDCPTVM